MSQLTCRTTINTETFSFFQQQVSSTDRRMQLKFLCAETIAFIFNFVTHVTLLSTMHRRLQFHWFFFTLLRSGRVITHKLWHELWCIAKRSHFDFFPFPHYFCLDFLLSCCTQYISAYAVSIFLDKFNFTIDLAFHLAVLHPFLFP